MLRLRDLALQPDFQLGALDISPSRRRVHGPAGETYVEPLIMQVLLLLVDARGSVVTRDELFNQCWGAAVVGDDSLNRAVAKVRRILDEVAPGHVEIETIPRTGYRLTGRVLQKGDDDLDVGDSETPQYSRRRLIGGTVAAAIVGTAGTWYATKRRPDPQFDTLMARGDAAFRDGSAFEQWDADASNRPKLIDIYEEAVRLQPDSAKAWGLLAYFRSARAESAPAGDSTRLVAEAKAAIRTALAIDPNEPNARAALYLFEGRMLDWTDREQRLRQILAADPDNLPAMIELMPLLQAAGFTRESWSWNEHILRASPLARPFLVIRSLKLWILGRIRESDNVIDRVRGLWPEYEFGNWVRFLLFAMTGRPGAALAMLDSAPNGMGDAPAQTMWRAALGALETRSPSAVSVATSLCTAQARQAPVMVNDIVMVLCALGQTDAAFDVTEGFLLWRGKLVSAGQADGKELDDYSRRMTQWLFTPPVAVMRADPRFGRLCDEFGLTAYWRARNVKPDYQRYG